MGAAGPQHAVLELVLQPLLWASFSYYGRMRSHQLEFFFFFFAAHLSPQAPHQPAFREPLPWARLRAGPEGPEMGQPLSLPFVLELSVRGRVPEAGQ